MECPGVRLAASPSSSAFIIPSCRQVEGVLPAPLARCRSLSSNSCQRHQQDRLHHQSTSTINGHCGARCACRRDGPEVVQLGTCTMSQTEQAGMSKVWYEPGKRNNQSAATSQRQSVKPPLCTQAWRTHRRIRACVWPPATHAIPRASVFKQRTPAQSR